MGARLSQPRGPGGTTESSKPTRSAPPPTPTRPFPRQINRRTIVAPAAALTMACLLFVYARTSIRAAKSNAQRHRDADSGGEGLSLLQEHRRRHGLERQVEGTTRSGGVSGTVRELAGEAKSQIMGAAPGRSGTSGGNGRSEEDERLRAVKRGSGRSGEGG